MTDDAKLIGEVVFSPTAHLHFWEEPTTGLLSVEVVTPERHVCWLVRDTTVIKLRNRFGLCIRRFEKRS